MNIVKYSWLILTNKPRPGNYYLFNFNLTKYIKLQCEVRMSWMFGIEIHKESYPYSTRLNYSFYKIGGYIGFGKCKCN